MQLFAFLYASSPRFFIGYWILQRGWVSTRPLLFGRLAKGEMKQSFQLIHHRFKLPLSNSHCGVFKG